MTDDFNPTDWITTKQTAELTGHTPSYIRKAIGLGRLEAQKIRRDRLPIKEDVLAHAEKMRRLGPAKHDPWRTANTARVGD
jgi:excisionase family DNA binding protein